MDERTQPIFGGPPTEAQFAQECSSFRAPHEARHLAVLGGPSQGQVFRLLSDESTIGRSPDCTVPLPGDPTISRVHARVLHVPGGHRIDDADSANGTYVNGVAVTSCNLVAGDVIQCGSVQLLYR